MIANGIGTWVIYGNNTTIDNFEMINEDNGLRGDAAWNQAAVYLIGNNLIMRNMYIHHNMQGFFNQTNQGNICDLFIENSIFDFNGDGGGHSHNLYVNHNITNLTMRGVWSRNCNGGHILKNRAYNSDVQGCMFTDPNGISLNWFVDIPDGGNHKFVGNIIEHNNSNTGSTMLAYGEDTPNPVPNNLLIAQNTFINDGKGAFIDKIQRVTPMIKENIFIGFNAPSIVNNQIAAKSELENPAGYNYRIAKPRMGSVNFASFAYMDSARHEGRVDSVYGAYFSSNATDSMVDKTNAIPVKCTLYQNYPDPFNPSTKIEFTLPKSSVIKLEVFNILGQKVGELLNGALNAGNNEVEFDGSSFSSGTYYYTITAGNYTETKKMVLLK
jgi:Secretion system C-terminal sorting domain